MSKLYFRYGAMSSGKSTLLLQVAHNYKEKDMEVLIIKPEIDTKGDKSVVSRLGIEQQVDILLHKEDNVVWKISHVVNDGTEDFYKRYERFANAKCILVDEAQFLTPAQVDELYYITKKMNIPVICYGLRCDFTMKGFPGSTRLLEIADDIEELKTICACGSKATQNLRKVNGKPTFEGEQVCIDDQENIQYEGVCGGCFLKLMEKI